MKGEGYFSWRDILLRYLVILVAGIFGVKIFYSIFLPLTIYPLRFFLDFFYPVGFVSSSTLVVNGNYIELIEACIGGAAYFLLLILNLGIRNIGIRKRVNLLLLTFGIFYLINFARIFLLTLLYSEHFSFFDITHKVLWYGGSTILVVLIWYVGVFLERIDEIPFLEDIKLLYRKSLFTRKD